MRITIFTKYGFMAARIYLDIIFFHLYVYIIMKLNIKTINISLIICLFIFIALYFKKTFLRENLQNIAGEQSIEEPNVSIASTGVNNAVELIDSMKSKNNMNVDYHNVIDRSENDYSNGNTLINTYSKIYPLRKEEIQLDNTLEKYKEEQAEIDELKKEINIMDKKIDELQVEMKTYNQVELELQEAIAKKAALNNDITNITSEISSCNSKNNVNGRKIADQMDEITELKRKLKGKQEIYETTLNSEQTLAGQYNKLQRRMDYLNQQPCCDGELITNGWINQNGSTTVRNTSSANINNSNTMKSNVIMCPGDSILVDGCSAINNLPYQQRSGGPDGTGATDTYSRLYTDNNGSYNQVAASDDSCFNRGVQGHSYVGPYYSYTHPSNLPCTKYVITNGGYNENTTMPRAYVTINGQPVNGCGRQ